MWASPGWLGGLIWMYRYLGDLVPRSANLTVIGYLRVRSVTSVALVWATKSPSRGGLGREKKRGGEDGIVTLSQPATGRQSRRYPNPRKGIG